MQNAKCKIENGRGEGGFLSKSSKSILAGGFKNVLGGCRRDGREVNAS